MTVPGEAAQREVGFRERLLMEYHNSQVAGHIGRDKCFELLERDVWWPRMYSDVKKWLKGCQTCAEERGSTGVTAWSRTELYEHPFRCLQIDCMTCRDRSVVSVIDCFSRWSWLIPVDNKDGETIAKVLLENVILSVPCFPAVLRSDRGPEFINDVVREVNRLLGIHHVVGSAYHPQSQGMVENLNKRATAVVRGLVEDHPEDWESRLPYAQGILRMLPMKCLGGRSPCEVVLGIKPKLPSALMSHLWVEDINVDDYVKKLSQYMQETYADVKRYAQEHLENVSGRGKGTEGVGLKVGDTVLVKRVAKSSDLKGPERFSARTWPGIYRITRGSGHSFHVRSVTDSEKDPPFSNPVNAQNLIKYDLPTVEMDQDQPRCLEILPWGADEVTGWESWHLMKFGVDGQVRLRRRDPPHEEIWQDLSRARYRWIMDSPQPIAEE